MSNERDDEKLQEKLAYLSAIVESSDDAIIATSPDGTISFWNCGAIRLLGYSPEEMIGRRLSDSIPNTHPHESISLEQALQGEYVGQIDTIRKHKDGSLLDVSISYSPIKDDGRILGVSAIIRDIYSQKETERDLRRRKEFNESISKAAVDAIIVIDEEGGIISFSPSAEIMFGVFSKDVVGKNVSILMPSPYREEQDLFLFAGKETGERETIGISREITCQRKDETFFPGEIVVSEFWLGKKRNFLGIIRDITERKNAERNLAHYAAIVESSEDAIIGATLKGIITAWNSGAEALFGYTKQEILGQPVFLITPKERFDESSKLLKLVESGKRVKSIDTVRIHKDGTLVNISLAISPIKDEGGVVIGVSGIARDIRERNRAEMSLAHHAAIVEYSTDSIVGTSLEGIITAWNAGAEALFGYGENEIIGQSVSVFLPSDRTDEADKILGWIKRGQRVKPFDTVRKHKDGSLLEVSLSVSPIKDPSGKIIGVSGISRDISERNRLQAELFRAQKMESFGQLTGGIAHEFNNLLAIMVGNLSFIDASANDVKLGGIRSNVKDMLDAGNRAVELVKQLSMFGRRIPSVKKPVALDAIVTRIVRMVRDTFDRRIGIVVKFAKPLPRILADSNRIQQVLLNLCLNARSAMESKMDQTDDWDPQITIQAHDIRTDEAYCNSCVEAKLGHFVRISVTDTGVGMDDETLEHTFEPFYSTKSEGTGLGLSVSHGIIKDHDGWFEVETQEGKGTTFAFHLPVTQDRTEEEKTLSEQRDGQDPPVGTETILVIDDEEMVRRLVGDILAERGYSILGAEDGQQGMDVFREHLDRIDLIILDLSMPRLSGEEMLKQLYLFDPNIKVIILSGYAQTIVLEKFRRMGAKAFVTKPFRNDDLVWKVREVLDGYREDPEY